MAKKKNKQQITNNIQQLNLEIDYDKLAETIVKAQEKAQEETCKNKRFTTGTFVVLLSIVFRVLAVLGWIMAVLTPFAIVSMCKSFTWEAVNILGNVIDIVFAISLMAIFFFYAFFLWKSAKEMEKEKDRNYIIAVFSGVVSFAALVVALVSLFKGVG